jgi:uncharacterized protein (TIRG00374 family)
LKLNKKAVVGIAVTAFLLWYIQRDVPFADVWAEIKRAHWGLLLASVVVNTAGFLIRAMRWRVLLAPVLPDSSLRNRFAAVNIGFMANNLLPARVGEFARAYALSRVEPIRMSAAVGSLVIERVFDAIVLLGILMAVMAAPGFPDSVSLDDGPLGTAVNAIVVAVPVLIAILVGLIVFPDAVVRLGERVARWLPARFERPVVNSLESFLKSLAVLRSPRLLALGFIWSVGFWLWHGLSFWLGLLAFDIQAGPLAAYFTEAVVGFVVAAPATPGFFGTFHFGAETALSVFGVPDAQSLAFAYGYHLGGFIPVTVIGLYYAGRIGLSLKEVAASGERAQTTTEREQP